MTAPRRRRAPRAACRRSGGFTLLNVLVAVLILGIGLLGMVRVLVGATATTTQNQHVSALATLSNGFWGVVQSNPALLTAEAFAGTYSAINYTTAAPALRPWLQQATSALPAGEATIATGPDAGSSAACAAATGCTVTLTLRWSRLAAPGTGGATRAQTFFFQFGL